MLNEYQSFDADSKVMKQLLGEIHKILKNMVLILE
jgi:hypothetical protein